MHTQQFTIAGMRVDLQSPVPPSRLGIQAGLGAFSSNHTTSPAEAVIHWTEGDAATSPGEMVYDPGDIWRMYRVSDGPRFCAQIAYPRPDQQSHRALVTANTNWDELSVTESPDFEAWSSLLSLGAGDLIVRTRILFHHGIVFHASGVDDNGRAILFVGHSGAGKSTQAALWRGLPGVRVMNDDRMAVRLDGPQPYAYDLPWGGSPDIIQNQQAPLAAIFLVQQATENSVTPLSASAAIPRLLPRSFLPYWDEGLMDRAFQTITSLIERVPIFVLNCRPEPSVVPLVRSVL